MTKYMLQRIELVTSEDNSEHEELKLTRGTKRIIKKAIIQTGTIDAKVLCRTISDIIIEKYTDKNGEINEKALMYQSARMNLSTTKDIKKAINQFLRSERRIGDLGDLDSEGC